jgi:methylenetetrahydrofolate dehydrogenase (NADP+) / methenyltetrahydrofolate cyclohydrolase
MTQASILSGRRCADALLAGLKALILTLPSPPALAVVRVGDDPASATYVNAKRRACAQIGIDSDEYHLAADITPEDLNLLIDRLNAQDDLDGILLQLPLPDALGAATRGGRGLIDRLSPLKDVDGFHPANLGLLFAGEPRFTPCTPLGVMTMLRSYGVQVAGRDAVVVGRSLIVGRPMGLLLEQANATVTVCHTRTRDLRAHIARAEVLVVAAGRPQVIPAEWIRPGAVVVDVGIHRTEAGKLVGDVDPAAAERAAWITPVPGGVGPMTVATLLYQTVLASLLRRDTPARAEHLAALRRLQESPHPLT